MLLIGKFLFFFCFFIVNLFIVNLFSKSSFDNLKDWINEIKKYSSPEIKMFLIGNKSDLEGK